jgi:hypothetical protein
MIVTFQRMVVSLDSVFMAEFPDSSSPEVITNYGSVGAGANVTADEQPIATIPDKRRLMATLAAGAMLASAIVAFMIFQSSRQVAHGKLASASPAILTQDEISGLDRDTPQRQSLLLLQYAINHTDGATDQIAAHLESWHGKLRVDAQLNTLLQTALNSNDLNVRAAAIEIQLIERQIYKNNESAEHWISQAQFGSTAEKNWALWILGLLGNRGVEQEQITQVLIARLRDPDPDVRHWAVEGLSYVGTDETIAPLLQTLHDDPSSMVRDRAACGLAQCGMLTHEQRQTIVPKLIEFAEDVSLDPATHSSIYHALRDITAQNLPENPAAWRNWYNSSTRS